MSETGTAASVEKHSVLLVGANPSVFQGEEIRSLRDPRVLLWTKHDVREGKGIPTGTKVVIYCSPEIGREKTHTLKQLIKQGAPGIQEFEVHNPDSLKTNLKNVLRFKPPVGATQADAGEDNHNPTGVIGLQGGANLEPPEPPAPPQPDAPPQSPQMERQVKLAPQGAQWKLPEFIRANSNANAPILSDEVRWVLDACHKNGFPDAQGPNIEQHIRRMRKEAGLGSARGSKAVVVVEADDDPVVTDFLALLEQLGNKAMTAAAAIRKERTGYKTAMQQLKGENEGLKQRLQKAVQAAELLREV